MDWNSRIQAAFLASAHVPDADVMEELAQHARAMYDTARAQGLSHDQADGRVAEQIDRWRHDAAALRRRTGRAPAVEPPHAGSTHLAGLAQDMRYAGRLFLRQPRYTLLVGLTMALGIGASTLLFSVIYGVLMKPLPWPHADRLVLVKETRGGNRPRFNSFSNAAYHAWRENAATIDGIAGWSQRTATLADAGEPERIRVTTASGSLFQVLGARPLIGSLFVEKDEIDGLRRRAVGKPVAAALRRRLSRARTGRAARRGGPPRRRRTAGRAGLSGSSDAGVGAIAYHADVGKQPVDV